MTGVTGQIGWPLARALAAHNEVWGCARFDDRAALERVAAAGIKPFRLDLSSLDLTELPQDFTYVVHLAVYKGPSDDYDHAITVNAEATGALLAHTRRANAVLVMSTGSVYKPHPDPFHSYVETDPLGDAHTLHSPTYSISKIAQEAVARYCARALGLRVVIARMNAAYGDNGGLLAQHLDAVLRGQPVRARSAAHPYTPIHEDDIAAQLGAMLDAAASPATIVNWGGDEIVTAQEWCQFFGELVGRPATVETVPAPGTRPGNIADARKRHGVTGPCAVTWREGARRLVSHVVHGTTDTRSSGGGEMPSGSAAAR
ncbi:MAG TPA: NAD(P)-dependent oxidoreductase [Acidimicrobiales bacterium]